VCLKIEGFLEFVYFPFNMCNFKKVADKISDYLKMGSVTAKTNTIKNNLCQRILICVLFDSRWAADLDGYIEREMLGNDRILAMISFCSIHGVSRQTFEY
jgi:hypothetical protein